MNPLRRPFARGRRGGWPTYGGGSADNPSTAAKVALGRRLFFDTRLSANEGGAVSPAIVPIMASPTKALAVGVLIASADTLAGLINRGFGRTHSGWPHGDARGASP